MNAIAGLGKLFTGLTSLTGKALKWGLGGGAVVVGAEQLTDDGQGGTPTRFIQNIWKKWTETSSTEQGRNTNIDHFYDGAAKGSWIMGVIAGLARAFGFEDFALRMEGRMKDQISAINQSARDFKAEGDVFDRTMTDSAQAGLERAQNFTTDIGQTVTNTLGYDDTTSEANIAVGAATIAGGTALGYMGLKKAFSSPAGSVAAATDAAADATAAATRNPGMLKNAFSAVVGKTWAGKALRLAGIGGGVAAATYGTEANDPDVAVSITENPMAFFADMGQGIRDLASFEKWTNGENVEATENNLKAAGVGAVSGAAWVAGQALDTLDTIADYGLGSLYDSTSDFSTSFSSTVSEYGTDMLGVDMSGAWAQTANFAGGFVGGGGAFSKGAQLVGKATGSLTPWFRGAAQSTAAEASAVATPKPAINSIAPIF